MVKMPVGINKVFDWVLANLRKRRADLLASVAHSCIYNEFSVRAGEYGNVPAGSCQNADVSLQLLNCDASCRGRPTRRWHKPRVLCEQSARSQKSDACYRTCGCEKTTTRNSNQFRGHTHPSLR